MPPAICASDQPQILLERASLAHSHPINAMHFSPDEKYLATGYDDGILAIWDAISMPWLLIRAFKTGATLRDLAWHPTMPRALVVGSGNGDINKLRFVASNELDAQLDFTGLEHLNGFIHAITINIDGSQIAVAYGQRIIFIDASSGFEERWPISDSNSIPTVFDEGPARKALTAGDIHYLDNETVLASFIEVGAPIIAYSTVFPYAEKWTMGSRSNPNIRMGHSAVSLLGANPKIRLLAVTNLYDGIDWYCLYRKRYMMSTQFSLGANCVTGIEFIDDMTIIAGHGSGQIVVAAFGMAMDPMIVGLGAGRLSSIQVQCLCGLRLTSNGKQLIAAAVSIDGNTSIFGLVMSSGSRSKDSTPRTSGPGRTPAPQEGRVNVRGESPMLQAFQAPEAAGLNKTPRALEVASNEAKVGYFLLFFAISLGVLMMSREWESLRSKLLGLDPGVIVEHGTLGTRRGEPFK